jgi:hypothetical protein
MKEPTAVYALIRSNPEYPEEQWVIGVYRNRDEAETERIALQSKTRYPVEHYVDEVNFFE